MRHRLKRPRGGSRSARRVRGVHRHLVARLDARDRCCRCARRCPGLVPRHQRLADHEGADAAVASSAGRSRRCRRRPGASARRARRARAGDGSSSRRSRGVDAAGEASSVTLFLRAAGRPALLALGLPARHEAVVWSWRGGCHRLARGRASWCAIASTTAGAPRSPRPSCAPSKWLPSCANSGLWRSSKRPLTAQQHRSSRSPRRCGCGTADRPASASARADSCPSAHRLAQTRRCCALHLQPRHGGQLAFDQRARADRLSGLSASCSTAAAPAPRARRCPSPCAPRRGLPLRARSAPRAPRGARRQLHREVALRRQPAVPTETRHARSARSCSAIWR